MREDLEKYKEGLQQKLGRNILLLQQIEISLKTLNSITNVFGRADELKFIIKQNLARKWTMGQVSKAFLDNIDPQIETCKPQNSSGLYVDIGLKVGNVFHREMAANLSEIVNERNDVVHHFSHMYDLSSFEDIETANQYLDKQYEKAKLRLQDLQALAKSVLETYKPQRDDLKEMFWQVCLRQNIVTKQLYQTEIERSRGDSWTPFGVGANFAKDEKEEVKKLMQEYSCKSIKEFVLKTDLFELKEEETVKGGKRLLYRSRSKEETAKWLAVREVSINYQVPIS